MADNELSLLNDPKSHSLTGTLSGTDTIRSYCRQLQYKYDALKEEHETLRKKYADLVGSHVDYVSKLELAHEESFRQRKSFEEYIQECNVTIDERNKLKQMCTAAIRQWNKALRENNELKEELTKVKQHRDEAMIEINQAMTLRIKTAKDMARLTEERNEALQEYTLIMSERDSVHKEIEKLQEEQQVLQKKNKQLENEKKVLAEETESLKREITSALFDRDRVLKICNDLREKYGDYVTGINDEATSPTSSQFRSRHNFWGSFSSGVSSSWAHMMSKSTNMILSAASSNSSVSTFSHSHNKLCSNSRLDNIDQANAEIEALRRQMKHLQTDLGEAQQEVEVCKRRRDWAFSERDKIVLERESIRILCDKLRRERDRAVSDFAEALRESDDIKHQRNEVLKELKELKEKFEEIKGDSRVKSQTSNPQLGTNNSSRDSAIEADLQEYEIDTKDIPTVKPSGERVVKPGDIRNIYIERGSAPSMGINISPSTSGGIFICNVTESSLAAQAGLLVGDQLLEICGINMRNATYSLAANVLRQCGDNIRMLVQYNPDKFKEDDNDSDGAEADEDDDMEDADEDTE